VVSSPSTILTLIIVPVVYSCSTTSPSGCTGAWPAPSFEAHEAAKNAAAVLLVVALAGLVAAPALAQEPTRPGR